MKISFLHSSITRFFSLKQVHGVLAVLLGLFIITTAKAQAQAQVDSIKEMLWQKSGGYARQAALGAGGFGLMSDTVGNVLTVTVNPYSVDPAFVSINPAYASEYANYLWADIGSSPGIEEAQGSSAGQDGGKGQTFGTIFNAGGGFSAGVSLARKDVVGISPLTSNLLPQELGSQVFNGQVRNVWEVLGAYTAGSVRIGAGVSYYLNQIQAKQDTTLLASLSLSQVGLNVGVLADLSETAMLDVAATALFSTFNNGAVPNIHVNYNLISLNARMLYRAQPNLYLVPIVDFYSARGTTDAVGEPHDFPSNASIDVGFGANYFSGPFHFVGGPSIGLYYRRTPAADGVETELNSSAIVFPRFNLGAEWNALSWLTARIGYFASTATVTIERSLSVNTKSSDVSTQFDLYSPTTGGTPGGVTLGLGLHWSGFALDFTVNEAALREGFGAFAGGNQTFGFVSASYNFGR